MVSKTWNGVACTLAPGSFRLHIVTVTSSTWPSAYLPSSSTLGNTAPVATSVDSSWNPNCTRTTFLLCAFTSSCVGISLVWHRHVSHQNARWAITTTLTRQKDALPFSGKTKIGFRIPAWLSVIASSAISWGNREKQQCSYRHFTTGSPKRPRTSPPFSHPGWFEGSGNSWSASLFLRVGLKR
ncbi:hypothetical protein AOQ84DRAFT_65329 [Glonium stellatum]|uniref:Uncharacterized protein n=1 Tax=Glonium stellatum TaxID=574774 RepID=A0A8E2EY96_9PEZI|nr:hypothetical protein AOQ84DRAFT_65329 [Glonium stellatum]